MIDPPIIPTRPLSPSEESEIAMFGQTPELSLSEGGRPLEPSSSPSFPSSSLSSLKDNGEGKVMSLGDHLAELRTRLLVCVFSLGITFAIGMSFYPSLWRWIRTPLRRAGEHAEAMVDFQIYSPQGGFFTIVSLVFQLAILVSLPILVYEIWAFVCPGLKRHERRILRFILGVGSILFLLGVGVAFYYGVPLGLQFFLYFNQTLEGVQNQWRTEEYIQFLSFCCLGFGLCFETPLVMMALAHFGLIHPEKILRYWRHVVLAIFILAAIVTPPDPFTQILLAGILILLFFIGYGLARWVGPPSQRGG